MESAEVSSRNWNSGIIFVLLFAGVFFLHLGLLRLPYFWDEAGYYVPAARDFWLTGSLIPHSTPSNAHPPLVMAYLAACWKIAGYAPVITRSAMLVVAAFSLLGLFRLAQRVANMEVAVACVLCTALYPVFFVQSSLAQVDLAAAGFTFWALLAYVEDRPWGMAFWFSCAALAKETAILAPLALAAWECALAVGRRDRRGAIIKCLAPLLIPVVPLGLWYGYHRLRTGFLFGNPEFFRYNVQATVRPLRIFLALLMRLWQVGGYMGLYVLTMAAAAAMWLKPRRDGGPSRDLERPRIALDTQLAFLAVIGVYVAAMAVIGGAVLARYMLIAVPLVILICVSTLWRRVRWWRAVIAVVLAAFALALFINPPYGFPFEDNLAYRDYIVLHQHADSFIEARYPTSCILTAWPASGELTQPSEGYLTRPMRVLQIEDFTAQQLGMAAGKKPACVAALVFSTKYDPPHALLQHWQAWQAIKTEYFGYHRDLRPEAAAQILGGHVVYDEVRNGQWIAVIEMAQNSAGH